VQPLLRIASLVALWWILLGSTASAAPYMWGVGPRIGTTFVPNAVPAINFPPRIENYDFVDEGPRAGDPRDLDAQGNPRFTTLERVRFDVTYGLDAFYALDRRNRIGAMLGFGGGAGFFDVKAGVRYDRVLASPRKFSLVGGFAAGFGQLRFRGVEPESLRVPYYPLQARLQAQLHDRVRAYALGITGELGIPSNTFYTDLDGEPQNVGYFNVARNATLGVELQVYFGDFTPPRPRKKKKARRPGRRRKPAPRRGRRGPRRNPR